MTLRNEGLAKLDGTRAPFFPYAKDQYSREEMDYFINMLRQYFIQNDRFTGSLIDVVGGAYLDFPQGIFENDATITPAAANTAYSIPFGTVSESNGVNIVSTSRITVDYSGVYNLQFSAQLANSSAAIGEVSIWLSKNNANVAKTNTMISVPAKNGLIPGYAVAAWNLMIPLEADDYIELKWSTTTTDITIPYYAAQTSPVRPETPAVIGTLTFVSRL
jgi:hypothetical protein